MATGMHIERRRDGVYEPISLDEWRAAVEATEGVRFASTRKSERHGCGCGPRTVGVKEGDVEVYFPDNDVWYLVFLWTERGAPTCSLCVEFSELVPAVRAVSNSLSTCLGAAVVDDDGHFLAAESGE